MKLNISIILSTLVTFLSFSLADWSCGPSCGRGTGLKPIITPWDGRPTDIVRYTKRDSYTCYKISNTSVNPDDCVAVINDVRSYNGSLTVPWGLCLMWFEGTCKARLCAWGIANSINETSAWTADRMAHPLLDNCIWNGADGVARERCDRCHSREAYCHNPLHHINEQSPKTANLSTPAAAPTSTKA